MAEAASDYHHGEMNVSAQAATFSAFVKLIKWGSLTLAALLVTLITWFCTTAGFLPGAIAFVVIMALGIAVMREKGGGHGH